MVQQIVASHSSSLWLLHKGGIRHLRAATCGPYARNQARGQRETRSGYLKRFVHLTLGVWNDYVGTRNIRVLPHTMQHTRCSVLFRSRRPETPSLASTRAVVYDGD